MTDTTIIATEVLGAAKFDFIPRHFGVRMLLRAEALVNATLRELCTDYTGGDWRFVDLSNGGYFMAPAAAPQPRSTSGPAGPNTMHLCVRGSHVTVDVSAEAAGIIATLFALGHLAASDEGDRYAEAYHLLLDFARAHAERASIFEAID